MQFQEWLPGFLLIEEMETEDRRIKTQTCNSTLDKRRREEIVERRKVSQ
jgi:hypothetical protein